MSSFISTMEMLSMLKTPTFSINGLGELFIDEKLRYPLKDFTEEEVEFLLKLCPPNKTNEVFTNMFLQNINPVIAEKYIFINI